MMMMMMMMMTTAVVIVIVIVVIITISFVSRFAHAYFIIGLWSVEQAHTGPCRAMIQRGGRIRRHP
jgi:hypothetical protein